MTETTNKDISSKIKKQDAPASIFKDFYGAIGTVLGGIKETVPSVKEAIEDAASAAGRLAKTHGALSNLATIADVLADGQVTGKEVGGIIGGLLGTALTGLAIAGAIATLPGLAAAGLGVSLGLALAGIAATHLGASLGTAAGGVVGGAVEEAQRNGGYGQGNEDGIREQFGRFLDDFQSEFTAPADFFRPPSGDLIDNSGRGEGRDGSFGSRGSERPDNTPSPGPSRESGLDRGPDVSSRGPTQPEAPGGNENSGVSRSPSGDGRAPSRETPSGPSTPSDNSPSTPSVDTNSRGQVGGTGATASGNQGDGLRGGGFFSPILLDLDDNGIAITELSKSTVFMDAGGDGLLHRTAWAGAGDGVLFFDADDDGTARPPYAPMPHPRDWKRQLSL